jgi:MarR family transcriptional regulator, organic hydroperoxide resistance regulator
MQLQDDRAELIADLHELVHATRQDHRLRESATGAPMPVMRAANIIDAQPGIGSSALAEALRLERSTVSNLLREMQATGLVRRRRLRTDRRFVSLELTDRGQALVLRAGRPGTGLLSRAIARLRTDEIARLTLALAPLLAAIRGDGTRADVR